MALLESLALLVFGGWLLGRVAEHFSLPSLVGMLLTGVLFGSYCFNLLSPEFIIVAPHLRTLALIIILLRAGLSLDIADLKKVGGPALALSLLPCLFEGLTILILSKYFLGFSLPEAGLLGFVLAAVSPAVVVPSMLELHDGGFGTNKQIPTMILAGAALDDVFAITFFGSFLILAQDTDASVFLALLKLPWQIGVGIFAGVVTALFLAYLFKRVSLQRGERLLLTVITAVMLLKMSEHLAFAGLLAIMALGLAIQEKIKRIGKQLAFDLTKVWLGAQIVLFTSLGAEVNIAVAGKMGFIGFAIIIMGLLGRSLGVWLALSKTNLNWQERLFCTVAYLPKATVQAAVGGIPLALGLQSGESILAISALAILITAPVGALV